MDRSPSRETRGAQRSARENDTTMDLVARLLAHLTVLAAMACGGTSIDGGQTQPLQKGETEAPDGSASGGSAVARAKAVCADSTHGPIDHYGTPAELTA